MYGQKQNQETLSREVGDLIGACIGLIFSLGYSVAIIALLYRATHALESIAFKLTIHG